MAPRESSLERVLQSPSGAPGPGLACNFILLRAATLLRAGGARGYKYLQGRLHPGSCSHQLEEGQ